MLNKTDIFIANLTKLSDIISLGSVKTIARNGLLDYLGVTLAGSAIMSEKERELLQSQRCPDGCYVLGTSIMVPINMAALMNGINAHVIELDDGHRQGAVHVGATVFSALLSVAEKERISSRDFFLGVIVGYEVTIRLACAVQPGNKLRGYHATGTCGTIGAALGIASALHYTEEQMNTTLAAAVTSAAGVLEMQEDDSDLKPYNVGRAAMDAVAAAYIGRTGFQGPRDALGGKRGFLKVMTDDPHTGYLTDFSGDKLCIEQIYQKVYAACRHAHPAIEAALTLRDSIVIEDIDEIEVEAYRLAVAGHDHTEVSSVSSAKMSIPFGVAVALVTGNAGIMAFTDETINDETILKLTKKVRVIENMELTALCPDKRASILTIHTKKGVFSKRVYYPKGEPENPLSQKELEDKFRELAMYGGLTEEECDEIIADIWKEDFDLNKILRIVNMSTRN